MPEIEELTPRIAWRLRLLEYSGRRRLMICQVQFEPRDWWIGLFWRWIDRVPGVQILHLYICLVPLLPVHLTVGRLRE